MSTNNNSETPSSSLPPPSESNNKTKKDKGSFLWRFIKGCLLVGFFTAIALPICAAIFVALAWPKLPSIDALKDYKPRMAMQVFTEDGQLIGEFGTERRKPTSIKDTPEHLKNAILAIEDARFYEHHGVDYYGLVRAVINNIFHPGEPQGASTITQQLAKNFFLTNERTLSRKVYEAMMAVKIENSLTKDEILERYMNHIYLGERAYGFAAAADIYFGKDIKDLTIAESAMLAALPQAPSANNPIRNRANAEARQQYVLQRMHELNMITDAEYAQAKAEVVRVIDTKTLANDQQYSVHAEYVAEMARQLMYDRYKDAAYTEGLKVYTTINSTEQNAAYNGVRNTIISYDRKYGYRGPEATYPLPSKPEEQIKALDKIFNDHNDYGELRAAVVTSVSSSAVKAILADGENITISGSGLSFARNALNPSSKKAIKIGSVIRVIESSEDASWRITQVPAVQASFVSMASSDGAIRSLVGGFDYNLSKFNHVTQALRQPGSGIKPFIYSSAMEKNGLTPSSIVEDTPIQVGSWRPKNSDGRFLGAITVAQALAGSRNMVSIRLLQSVGNDYFRQYATRFGFDPKNIDQYLTVALGAVGVTSWQMVDAYGVFANGGYKVNPYIISKVIDRSGAVILQAHPTKAGDPSIRVITEKNAAMTDALMRGVVQHGTGRAALALGRSDIAGKTGTTNDSKDAWFNGYQPKLVGIAWMGFDRPKSLGAGEYGGTLALPIWMSYMRVALKNQKIETRKNFVDTSAAGAPPTTADQTGQNLGVAADTPPEELKVDSRAVPPANNEARQAAEKVNQADVQEAEKIRNNTKQPVDPLTPFTFKPPEPARSAPKKP